MVGCQIGTCIQSIRQYRVYGMHDCCTKSNPYVGAMSHTSCIGKRCAVLRLFCHLSYTVLAMLCCAVLCCAVLCCAVLCCAVLCCAVLCYAMPHTCCCSAAQRSVGRASWTCAVLPRLGECDCYQWLRVAAGQCAPPTAVVPAHFAPGGNSKQTQLVRRNVQTDSKKAVGSISTVARCMLNGL